jgi:hypothetical protein
MVLRAVAALLVTVVVVACGGGPLTSVGPNSLVDGWSIGDESACAELQPGVCDAYIEVANEGLASRDGGHPAIVETVVHGEGLYPNLDGDFGMIYRGGPGVACVVLFRLVDGTYRAIAVANRYHSSEPLNPLDRGPGVRQEHTQFQAPAPTF